MTAEELLRLCDRIISSGGFDTLTSVDRCTIARALRDRLTDAQAQRIAELEAQLATAQAVTLTEEERVVFRDAKIWVNLQGINPARPMVRQLTDIIDRLTGASTPAQEGEKL